MDTPDTDEECTVGVPECLQKVSDQGFFRICDAFMPCETSEIRKAIGKKSKTSTRKYVNLWNEISSESIVIKRVNKETEDL